MQQCRYRPSIAIMKSTKSNNLMFRAAHLAGLVAGLTLLVDFVAAQDVFDDSSSGHLQVEIVDDLVTLKARDVSVETLLKEIVRQTDLVVVLHGPLDKRITMELHELPLSETLHRILRDETFALHEAQTESAAEKSPYHAKLWVFSGGSIDPTTPTGKVLRPSSAVRSSADIEALESDVINGDIQVRKQAVRGLRRLDADQAVTPLSLALGDEDEDVRVKAIYALADFGGDEAAASLTTALGDTSAWVRTEAAYALGATGGDTAIQVLKQAMRDTERDVRETAIEAYTDIGGDDSARALVIALDDPDTSLRIEAVDALGEIGGGAAIQILQLAFEAEENEVREAVIEALIDIGGDEAARPLATALSDDNTDLRAQAVDALGKIGGKIAIRLLRQALNDPESSIRAAADKNLAKLSNSEL